MLYLSLAEKKEKKKVASRVVRFIRGHNFKWKTIAGINCFNFAYFYEEGKKRESQINSYTFVEYFSKWVAVFISRDTFPVASADEESCIKCIWCV